MYIMPASTTRRSKKERPVWAEAIRLRRLQLDLKQEDVEALSGDLITQSTVSNIEMGKLNPSTITASRLGGLLQALRWTPQEFTEATGIDLPGFSIVLYPPGARLGITTSAPTVTEESASPPVKNLTPLFSPGIEMVKLPLLGSVSAGLSGNGESVSYIDLKDVPLEALEGSNPEDCFLLQVDGDSMACEDVKKDIPPGALVIIDKTLEPDPGDIIVCELEVDGERMGVLKIFRPKGDYALLESYNEVHKPIIIDRESQAVFRGTYVNHFGPGRRARRKKSSQ
jgi:SOS-response transcriptional repressor LexA